MKKKRSHYPPFAVLPLAALLLVLAGMAALPSLLLADEAPPSGQFAISSENLEIRPANQRGLVGMPETLMAPGDVAAPARSRAPLSLPPDPAGRAAAAPDSVFATCRANVLVNSTMNIFPLDDEFVSAEPWWAIDPIVSAIYNPNDPNSNSFLFMEIGELNDPSPNFDSFGQAVFMPQNLESIKVEYDVAMVDLYPDDDAYGWFYRVESDGSVDWSNPVTGWLVSQVQEADRWYGRVVQITRDTQSGRDALNALQGERVLLLFENFTENPPPPADPSTGELVAFDNITMEVCTPDAPSVRKAFLPALTKPGIALPVCIPPSENPADHWTNPATMGMVEAGATCNTTMDSFDRRDYYEFTPETTGAYHFEMTVDPTGERWQMNVWTLTASPQQAAGGGCFASQIGTTKASTCTLTAGTDYFILVAAGDEYSGPPGNYQLQVTGP